MDIQDFNNIAAKMTQKQERYLDSRRVLAFTMESMYCQLSKTSMPPLYNSKSMSSRGWLCLGLRICSYPTLDSGLRHRALGKSQYGAGAAAFQIAQVGNDLEAMIFLGRVDKDRSGRPAVTGSGR